jgi:hypothetical protein
VTVLVVFFGIVDIFCAIEKNRLADRFFSDIAYSYNARHMKKKGQRKKAIDGVKEDCLELRLYAVESRHSRMLPTYEEWR